MSIEGTEESQANNATNSTHSRDEPSLNKEREPEVIFELSFESFSDTPDLEGIRKELKGDKAGAPFAGNCVTSYGKEKCTLGTRYQDD